jgi:hypothetical protein
MCNVGWYQLDENGSSKSESKVHLLNDRHDTKTLCGRVIPTGGDFDVASGIGNGTCKRCEKSRRGS